MIGWRRSKKKMLAKELSLLTKEELLTRHLDLSQRVAVLREELKSVSNQLDSILQREEYERGLLRLAPEEIEARGYHLREETTWLL